MSRSNTARSMSYTGCWTCRKRRIKCDEKPISCQTCTDANLVCGGYDVRLIWNTRFRKKQSSQQASRRQIQTSANSRICMSEADVTKTLAEIDKAALATAEAIAGPFTVFVVSDHPVSQHAACSPSVRTSVSDEHNSAVDSEQRETYEGAHNTSNYNHAASGVPYTSLSTDLRSDGWYGEDFVTASSNDDTPESSGKGMGQATHTHQSHGFVQASSSSPEDIPSQPTDSTTSIRRIHSRTAEEARDRGEDLEAVELDEIVLGNFEQTMLPPTMPLGVIGSPSQQMVPINIPSPAFTSSELELSRRFIDNSTTQLLVTHYTDHIVQLMQPIAHDENPFRTIYLPLAVAGLERVGRPEQFFFASIAAFHSLLSTAALNLQDKAPELAYLKQFAWHHKQRSLTMLRKALTSPAASYKEVMTGILSLVSTDIMDGGTSDHWVHLEAGVQLQASRHYGKFVSRETQLLNSICTMLHLFSQTTLSQAPGEPWPGSYQMPKSAENLSFGIEFIYGITPTVARNIMKIRKLSEHIAFYDDQDYPISLMEAVERLGDELHSWTISSENFPSFNVARADTLNAVRAQTRAFHSAAMIYYYRSIQQTPRDWLRKEQQDVLSAMNEAEDLKEGMDGASYHPAPITWPAFIASCEAIGHERELWEDYWTRIQSYRMPNYRCQLETVRSVWADLGNENPDKDWRDCLAARKSRIIPV